MRLIKIGGNEGDLYIPPDSNCETNFGENCCYDDPKQPKPDTLFILRKGKYVSFAAKDRSKLSVMSTVATVVAALAAAVVTVASLVARYRRTGKKGFFVPADRRSYASVNAEETHALQRKANTQNEDV